MIRNTVALSEAVIATEIRMGLLFFSREVKGAGERLKGIIEAHVPEHEIEIYRSVKSLSDRFHKPTYNLTTLILLAATQKDLTDLLHAHQLFNDIPIILILPDREENTILEGLKVFPRYMTYADGDFLDVSAVIGKMLNHNKTLKTERR